MSCKGAHGWWINGIPITVEEDAVSTNPVVSSFLSRAICAQLVQFNLEFQFMATTVMHQWLSNPVTWMTRHG